MKKTLIALFALSGVALAETEMTLPEATYSVKDDSLTLGNNVSSWEGISVVLTLDVTVLKNWVNTGNNGLYSVFSTEGATSQGNITIGLKVNKQDTGSQILGFWGNNTDNLYGQNDAPNMATEGYFDNVTDMSVVFTYSGGSGAADVVLTLLKSDNSMTQTAYELTGMSSSQWTVKNSSTIAGHYQLIKSIDVYDTKLNDTVALNVGKAAVIPEPATATLSLLALAGLAARRRRK